MQNETYSQEYKVKVPNAVGMADNSATANQERSDMIHTKNPQAHFQTDMEVNRKLDLVSLILMAGFLSLHGEVAFTNLVYFTNTNAPNYGANLDTMNERTCALIMGDDGNFYGTTSEGGSNLYDYGAYGYGTVFRMTPDGFLTSLYSFGRDPIPGLLPSNAAFYDGTTPTGNLIKGADGRLYGVTYNGGHATNLVNGSPWFSPAGTAFSITTNGSLATLYSFGSDAQFNTNLPIKAWVNADGSDPAAGLVQGRDGNFYGTTSSAGAFGWGTIFRLTPDGFLTTLYSFTTPDTNNHNYDGLSPGSELVEGKDGNFYGTTTQGGDYNGGTVFKITPTGGFTTLLSFNGTNGWSPVGGLVLGKDGNFYGTTEEGSPSGILGFSPGVVFRLTTNGVLTVLHYFTGYDGAEPVGTLIQGSDGNFYGTTQSGGHVKGNFGYSLGTVFQIKTNGTLTTLYAFNGADGQKPKGALLQGTNGSLYGATSYGGLNYSEANPINSGYGTIFRIIIPPTFQSITPTNGGMALSWSVMPGQTCQLQYSTNLVFTNWINLGTAVTATNAVASATDSITRSQCYYRIALTQ